MRMAKPTAPVNIKQAMMIPRERRRSERDDMARVTMKATAYGGTVNSCAFAFVYLNHSVSGQLTYAITDPKDLTIVGRKPDTEPNDRLRPR